MTDTAYKNHPVRAVVKQILDLQSDEELAKVPTALSEDQQWQRDRVFEVARIVEGLLEQTPATLVAFSQLANLQNGLQAALNELNNFRGNKNAGHLKNASNNIDQSVIPYFAAFAPRALTFAPDKLAQLSEDLRTRSHAVIEVLTKERDDLQRKLEELKKSVAAQDQKVSELATAVETQKKEAVAVTAEVKTEYAKVEKELRANFDTALTGIKTDFEKLRSETSEAAEKSLAELTRNEVDAKRIVQVVGNIGVTGNYQKIANQEASKADWWRLATVGFFLVGVGLAGYSFYVHLNQAITPGNFWTFALRFVTALAIASPAFYTARESARHRTNADRARQRELELASLGPFIELLPKERKEEIREKLVERYFGNDVEPHEIKHPIEAKEVIGITKAAVDGLAKAAKS